ncbi:AfsR/SARP family transcriptional regulator [Kitasatospora sp. NBC_01266]|uniref:AfsR/SARP family transcriptional regulator n=1 Tax=Kitasatospora sp. NBC_01266 TaxID=2903572 RepID=UPI002E33A8B8|nr:tetratricopeptide repeat protein [Kitasatospora sp. NBC_01266]
MDAAPQVRFGILGPLSASCAGQPVDPLPGRQRTLLAALLVRPNRVLPADSLAEAVWDGRPPAGAATTLRSYVMRLRRSLGPQLGARVLARTPGYLVEILEDAELDALRFAALRRSAEAAAARGELAAAAEELKAALGLWRGTALEDVSCRQLVDEEVPGLTEGWVSAHERLADLELRTGQHHEVIRRIPRLQLEHPYREQLSCLLMRAQLAAGRRAEALAEFSRLRRALVDGLGIEPGPDCRALQAAALDGDAGAGTGPGARGQDGEPGEAAAATEQPQRSAASRPVPCQLPADTRAFTGRCAELDQLVALADRAPGGTGTETVVISAIDGMGGVGKSALAIHAAHRVRGSFPDGQLFIDLRGHAAGTAPLSAADALDWFLRSLGVPPQLIPQDLDERAAFYRDRLAGTRTLILLDNAASTAQVRPLLPGDPGCLVLVTSRKHLTGLDDAYSVTLDTLSGPEAVALLRNVAGPGRISADDPAVHDAVELCGYLPLAIRIVAARVRHRRALPVQGVVAQLQDESLRLDSLRDEDRNLAAVFETSYSALTAAEQGLFRLLGLIPGPDFDAHAAASLGATDFRGAERLLESLLDHNLLTQHTPERYRFHDLIRLYARTLTVQDSGLALERLLGHYLRTARAADRRLARFHRPGPAAVDADAVTAGAGLADRASALDWLRGEQDNLLACVEHARAHGRPDTANALTGALATFLHLDGRWQESVALHEAVIASAGDLNDPLAEANSLCDIGRISYVRGDFPAATATHERALEIFRRVGNRLGEANALLELGRVRGLAADFAAAAELFDQALAGYRSLGDRLGEANTIHELGCRAVLLGDYTSATTLLKQAQAIHQDIDDPVGQAHVLVNLGRASHSTGDSAAAVALMRSAATMYQELGIRQGEANALKDLGTVLQATGDLQGACALKESALAIYQSLGNRHGTASVTGELGEIRHAAGDHTRAAELLAHSLTLHRELGDRQGSANTLHPLAQVRHALGQYAAAGALLDQCLAEYRELGNRQGQTDVLTSMGDLAADLTGPAEALALYRQAVALARQIGSPAAEARALDGSARCHERLGEHDRALDTLRQAVAVYRRIGSARLAAATARLDALAGR